MAKKKNRSFPKGSGSAASALALSLCVNLMAMPVTAAEGTGTLDDPEREQNVVVEVVVNEDTTTTTTTTTTETWEGSDRTETQVTPEEGAAPDYSGIETTETTVEGQETTVEQNTDLPDGRPLSREGEISGSETTTTTTVIEENWTEDRPAESGETTTEGETAIVTDTTDGAPEDIDLTEPMEENWAEGEKIDVSENAIPDVTVDLTPNADKDKDGKPDANEWVKAEGDTDESMLTDAIAPPADSETTTVGANGETVHTVTRSEPVMENGKVVGYTTVTTVTTTHPAETHTDTQAYVDGETEAQKAETDTTTEQGTYSEPGTYDHTGSYTETDDEPFRSEEITIALPEKPAESETASEDGGKVTVTVEPIVDESLDLDGDGQPDVVGYTTTTTVTDREGNVLSQEDASVWGTRTTVTTEVRPTADIEVTKELVTTTTTQLITQGVTGTGRMIVATDREVYGWMSRVEEGESHGDTDLAPSRITHTIYDEDLKASNYNAPYYQNGELKWVDPNGEQFKYVNYGLASEFYIAGNEVHFFELEDENGNKFYAYCTDHSTSAIGYTLYNTDNLSDVSYFGGASNSSDPAKVEAAREQLRAITENGYWGNDQSLANAQALVDEVYGKGVYKLTPGQAMSATQAAIWYIGFSGQNSPVTATSANSSATGSDKAAIDALYKALISSRNSASNTETDFIDAGDITNAGITVKEKLAETQNGSDVYNTDISFGLGVEESSINGDLIVTVYDNNGKALRKIRVAGDDAQDKEDGLFTRNFTKNGTDYVLHDLQLAENVTITLNLTGTQNLEQGVYVFTATGGHKESQTFITNAVGSDGDGGTYDVDLSVDLVFKVTEPEAHVWETEAEEENDFTRTLTTERIDTTVKKTVTAELSVSTLIEDGQYREWQELWSEYFSYDYPVEPIDGEDPNPDKPDTPVDPDDPDLPIDPDDPDSPNDPDDPDGSNEPENVGGDPTDPTADPTVGPEHPLANVPRTGGAMGLMKAVNALSAMGLAWFSLKKRKD